MNLRLSFTALAALGLAVTACGSGPSGATPTPSHSGGGVTATPASSATATPAPSADGQYPAMDTPYNSLSDTQKQVWSQYAQLTLSGGPNDPPADPAKQLAAAIVPGREIFSDPSMPKVTNATSGGLSDADATKLAALYWKDEQLLNWGAQKGQAGVILFSHCPSCIDAPVVDAMDHGTPVQEQACNIFARAITVIPVTGDVQNWFGGEGGSTAGKFALLLTYDFSSDCGYAISGQAPYHDAHSADFREILGGTVSVDPALGSLFIQDAISACISTGAVAADCS